MPPKASQKAIAAKNIQAHDTSVNKWAKGLWRAVLTEASYSNVHDEIFKEFKKLRDEAKALGTTKVSMLNHVSPIYNHMASQGYQAKIHYLPLREAVANYCENRPAVDWKGPPDHFNRSPSPPALKPSDIPRMVVGPSKKKGKAPVVEESVKSDREDSDAEVKHRKPLPSTDGFEVNSSKCTMCRQRSHACHVNPKVTKTTAACFECNYWRLKCSFSPLRNNKKVEGLVEANDEESKKRKKPTQVPAGQAGQYSGEFFLIFFPPT